jgi:pimeloyl-ACP methyl ester carboxylesterase
MNLVEVHGIPIAYDRAGAGAPIVLAHGGAGDAREWTFQAPLADEFDLVTWDEPGSGRSGNLPPGWDLGVSATALAGLIEALELGRAHVGGLSWGGVVALELYRRRPELVASLILADTYAGWKGSLPSEEVAARRAGFERSLAAPPESREGWVPGLFKVDPLPPRIAELQAKIDADVRVDTMRALIPAVAEADLSGLLPNIEVPVLLIWGADDVRSPLDTVGRQFERAIPGAELVVIADCGHMSSIERPDEFNRAVREFCRAHRPAPPSDPSPIRPTSGG